jgi:hypothetical protein
MHRPCVLVDLRYNYYRCIALLGVINEQLNNTTVHCMYADTTSFNLNVTMMNLNRKHCKEINKNQ